MITSEHAAHREIEEKLQSTIKEHLRDKNDPHSYCVEISIIRYSAGKEIYSLSDAHDDIAITHGNNVLETIVRIKKDNKTRKVFFIKVEADNSNKLLYDFIDKLTYELHAPLKKE
ncbi:MAG: hypothetical protein N2316_02555 [Spirochaetes bacterium]|nr:hypothetical protein [Spirochaetota bacterium]